MNTTSAVLSVEDLGKSYGPKRVLENVTFSANAGEFICLVGPSGAGKTTLLRCISQLAPIDEGVVKIRNVPVTEPPEAMALVFQDYSRSLLPWMRVRANVEMPLRATSLSKDERERRISDALEAVRLSDSAGLYPWQLSGGMQQRVAIARALACNPQVLVMDEPFASVDAQTRADLEDLVLSVRRKYGVTIVLVTHDIDEAVYLSDKVVVLSGAPARVTETVNVPLGEHRDQVGTKALPEFLELRAHIHDLIMRAAPDTRKQNPAEQSATT